MSWRYILGVMRIYDHLVSEHTYRFKKSLQDEAKETEESGDKNRAKEKVTVTQELESPKNVIQDFV